jgi:preprotein translocase subunit SecF
MQIFTNTNIDFLGKTKLAAVLSCLTVAAGMIGIFTIGFNLGIDFQGGTEIELKFAQARDLPDLRGKLEGLGMGQVGLQQVGRPEENTILIRVEDPEAGRTGEVSRRIVQALYTREEAAALAAGRLNLNEIGTDSLATLLAGCPAGEDGIGAGPDLAEEITALRVQRGVLESYDEIGSLPAVTPEIRSCLEESTFLPGFAKWKDYFVGPKVGEELREKAIWAIAVSLVGILIYITIRFQFEYGVGAVLALFHDVIITTGLLVLLRLEFSLTIVAALLTLAGYSINDTIVVFDRIRENLKVMRTQPFEAVVNRSINQTLSRTVLTAVTTLLVIASLFVFGGSELEGFSTAMFLGVIIGTYSSVFVASPAVIVWRKYFPRVRSRRAAARA